MAPGQSADPSPGAPGSQTGCWETGVWTQATWDGLLGEVLGSGVWSILHVAGRHPFSDRAIGGMVDF